MRDMNAAGEFEPKNAFRWTLHMPGVDAFCARTFRLLPMRRAGMMQFEATFYSVLSDDNVEMQLYKLQANPSFECCVKFLDGLGSVKSSWQFADCELQSINVAELDYARKQPIVVSATVSFRTFRA